MLEGAPTWLLLTLGGAAGTLARYGLGSAVAAAAMRGGAPGVLAAPVGTLVINVIGCAAIGAIAGGFAARPDVISPELRLLGAVGFCGGFTTFSSFGLETVAMLEGGFYLPAAAYVVTSNVLGLAAAALGLWAVRSLA